MIHSLCFGETLYTEQHYQKITHVDAIVITLHVLFRYFFPNTDRLWAMIEEECIISYWQSSTKISIIEAFIHGLHFNLTVNR